MTLTDRDKKILTLLIPVALIAAYWFLVFSPKREESSAIQERLAQAQTDQQTAEAQAASVAGAKSTFNADYTTVIKLGKAVPSTVDMPSLLMQLDRAARGTGIDFDKVSTGERTAAPVAAAAPADGSGGAQSDPGKAKKNAEGAADTASTTGTLNGAQPGAAGGATPTGAAAPGLESVGLDFTFHGTFFDLADFFHRMKRFVKVVNDDIVVRGRLMTVDSFNWKTEAEKWPNLTAEVHATVYLAPKAEGVSAGATPAGPGATPATPAASGAAPAAPSSSPATTAPAATVK